MSTRASIVFKDKWDTFFVYRHSDGYPDGDILPDLHKTVNLAQGRWSGSELGQLVSMFFGITYRENARIQSYELTSAIHGDESYYYHVEWNGKEYVISYGTEAK